MIPTSATPRTVKKQGKNMDRFPVVDGVTVFMAAPDGYEVDFDHPKRRLELEAYIVCGVGLLLALFFFVQFLYVKVWVLRRLDGEAGKEIVPTIRLWYVYVLT